MNRRQLLCGAAAAAIMLLIGCKEEPANRPATVRDEAAQLETGPRLGYRVTPQGGLGIELAPGIVMGFDGRVGVGVGF